MTVKPLNVTEALQNVFETLRALAENPQAVETVHIDQSAEAIHIQVVLHTSTAHSKSRWARFADELHAESPLHGRSEHVIAQARQFRDHFTLEPADAP